ncbi:dihydrofolate reductase [Pedobacter psychrophilus]|uniref:Dihydrofolate reductase n=2 Tax=Pedobacter psychrophilus TaxID=1826909 RepID=A0A179DCY9_9SPHI|nr:dihydrofolate reductase [Pedobacter psychrophilus]
MGLSLIVATDSENGIGKNNQLLWHLPNDLKFFKKTTSGHTVIMGRKTYDSIGKPLPNRRNIIITRKKDLKIEGVEVFNSLEKALNACANEEQAFVIGGGEIYREALPLIHQIYLTKVHHQFNADTFFPSIDALDWEVIFKEDHQKDEKHAFDYSFLILKRH